MCGICGLVAEKRDALPSVERLQAAAALLRHRGPDGSGIYLSPAGTCPAAALAHRRLSIIDLAGGQQPMSNEDGTVWASYNGEIYNFRKVRDELVAAGHRFKTQSDTEVILHSYEEFGEGFVKRLLGMFAFALWDDRNKRLLLARDRLGQKPLFYAQSDGIFAFGSQPKAIFAMGGFEPRLDMEALDAYLTYQYVPHPLSIYQGVHKLPPGCTLVYEKGQIRTERYWRIDPSRREIMSEEEACERVREALRTAVRSQLVSDVPLGAFLSGGIDSTIVVGLMAEASARPVETFSIGFEEQEFNELRYARSAATKFRTSHHEMIVRPSALEALPVLVEHFDEPFADSSAIPCLYLAEMTRKHVTVALTGDAGDECFMGYNRYKAVRLAALLDRFPPLRHLIGARIWQKIPTPANLRSFRRQLQRMLSGIGLPDRQRYLHWMSVFPEDDRRALYTESALKLASPGAASRFLDQYYAEAAGLDPVSATAYVDLCTYLPGDLLVKVDITSMAHSLEARSPFLDHPLVELAASLPTEMKLRGRRDKYILKKAFADLLPEETLRRGKMGFGVPIAHWLRNELRGFLRDHLPGKGCESGPFSRKTVENLVAEHLNETADHSHRLWALLVFELWARRNSAALP